MPLIPSDPESSTVITQVTENILTFSAPFWRFGRIKIGGRSTLGSCHTAIYKTRLTFAVRLQPSGTLAIFSPTALTDGVRAKVKTMGGDVRYIAALDLEHHLYISDWAKEFPQAKVIGPEGLSEKRKKQGNEAVQITEVTAKQKDSFKVDPEFDSNFDFEFVDAHANKELVFNYKPDKTLIEADLIFNLPATQQFSKAGPGQSAESGILTRLFSYINNTQGKALAQKRFIWYAISAGDRNGYSKSMSKINAWDFNRIIPCHGDIIETNGKGIFQKVMEWHLEQAGKKAV